MITGTSTYGHRPQQIAKLEFPRTNREATCVVNKERSFCNITGFFKFFGRGWEITTLNDYTILVSDKAQFVGRWGTIRSVDLKKGDEVAVFKKFYFYDEVVKVKPVAIAQFYDVFTDSENVIVNRFVLVTNEAQNVEDSTEVT